MVVSGVEFEGAGVVGVGVGFAGGEHDEWLLVGPAERAVWAPVFERRGRGPRLPGETPCLSTIPPIVRCR